MERIVKEVKFAPILPKKKKVAAYVRVSADKYTSIHSLTAQADYYKAFVSQHCDWELLGIYADEGITGTKESRPEFQRLISDCKNGLIDMIITKSVSRFARNTVLLLKTVRELKNLDVDIFFEEENIHSLSSEGEVMLALIASIAQDQSLSVSENMNWRVQKRFEEGIPWDGTLLGYRLDGDKYVVVPQEAKIVRLIYSMYLAGNGLQKIANKLNSLNYRTRLDSIWYQGTVRWILCNYTYTGNLILKKTYRENHLNKRKHKNNGEFPFYHAENTHEAIITIEDYRQVQEIMQAKSSKFYKGLADNCHPLRGRITCGCCGKKYQRRTYNGSNSWICSTYKNFGKNACSSKIIPGDVIESLINELGGLDNINSITALNDNKISFTLFNGDEIIRHWQDRSRSDAWTAEMREQQSKLTKEKMKCQKEK